MSFYFCIWYFGEGSKYLDIILDFNPLIDQVGSVFANGLVDLASIPGHVTPKTLKNGT